MERTHTPRDVTQFRNSYVRSGYSRPTPRKWEQLKKRKGEKNMTKAEVGVSRCGTRDNSEKRRRQRDRGQKKGRREVRGGPGAETKHGETSLDWIN